MSKVLLHEVQTCKCAVCELARANEEIDRLRAENESLKKQLNETIEEIKAIRFFDNTKPTVS